VCLTRVLEKFERVLQALRRVETALLEDSGVGQWHLRIDDLEREVKRRVPNFEVIVAFSQQKSGVAWAPEHSKEYSARRSMISEIGLKLMWLYHRSLPSIPAEARYDIGKLLFSPAGQQLIAGGGDAERPPPQAPGLAILSQFHLLRLFHHSGQFAWWTIFGECPLLWWLYLAKAW
jgi:nucleolar pre-ribosomal-associated protein 1